MKTLMFTMMLFASAFCYAQKGKVINTEDGKRTVYVNSTGQEFIDFDIKEWNEIFPQNFIDIRVIGQTVRICVKIATRRSNCKSGIGFRCKDCNEELVISAEIERYEDAYYEVVPKENKVRLTFYRKIDWDALAKN